MVEDNKQPVKEEQLIQNKEDLYPNFKGFEKKGKNLIIYEWNYNKDKECYEETKDIYPIEYLKLYYKYSYEEFKQQVKNMVDPKLNIIIPDSGEIDFDTPINTNNEEVNFNDSDVWPVDYKEDIETIDEDCVQ